MELSEHVSELILNEYITNDVVYLKDYFSMPKSVKLQYLPHMYYYFFDDFLIEQGVDFEPPKEEFINAYDEVEYGDEIDSIELINWLEENNKELYNKFAEYLFDKVSNHTLPINDSEYPAWTFFDDNPKLIKNQWLIHFTDDAKSIAEDGFIYGVDDMEKLGLTTHLGEFDKKYSGYNFAYTLNDFQKYGTSSYGNWSKSGYKYGNEVVVFKASGIKLWHYGDNEPQVIFYGNTAKNIIPITEGENYQFGVYSSNGNLLYENDNLPKVVNWITNNYQQYRKKITLKEYIKTVINENLKPNFQMHDKYLNDLKSELNKFKTDEELLRSGGISIDTLDRLAHGFSEDDVKTLKPNQLRIRWKNDLENVKWEINKSGLTPKQWAKTINLSEPIDVDYWENSELNFKRGFYIQDGHHRYLAAKILNTPLNVNLTIKVNPIKTIAPKMGYDEFHREIFKLYKQSN